MANCEAPDVMTTLVAKSAVAKLAVEIGAARLVAASRLRTIERGFVSILIRSGDCRLPSRRFTDG